MWQSNKKCTNVPFQSSVLQEKCQQFYKRNNKKRPTFIQIQNMLNNEINERCTYVEPEKLTVVENI